MAWTTWSLTSRVHANQAIRDAIARTTKIDDSMVADIMSVVTQGPLELEDKSSVVAALTATPVAEVTTSQGQRIRLQSMDSAWRYFTKSDWDAIASNANVADKISVVVRRMLSLGLRNPTEKTFAAMAAVLVGTSLPSVALNIVRAVKTQFRCSTVKLVDRGVLDVYPDNTAELKESHPLLWNNAYGDDEPMEVAGEDAWKVKTTFLPMRATRTGCSQAMTMTIGRTTLRQKHSSAALWAASPCGVGRCEEMLDPSIGLRTLGSNCSFGSPPPGPHPAWVPPPPPMAALAMPPVPQLDLPPPGAQLALRPALGQGEAENAVAKMVKSYQEQLKGSAPSNDDADEDETVGGPVLAKVPMKKPSAAAGPVIKRPASSAIFALGCTKCRMSVTGCAQCRRADFAGKRRAAA